MRLDVAPRKPSDALALVSAGAVAAIIRDGRQHDQQFVNQNAAMLFRLAGDETPKVSLVVDERVSDEEQRAMITRVAGLLDLRGGTLLVCAGLDPRSLDTWRQTGQDDHVVAVRLPPGWYRVVVGATLASGNGQALAGGAGSEAPAYGWLVALQRMQGNEITVQELSLPDQGGWFPVETGLLEAWRKL